MPKKKRNTKKTKSWQEGLFRLSLTYSTMVSGKIYDLDSDISGHLRHDSALIWNIKENKFTICYRDENIPGQEIPKRQFNNPVQYIGYPTVAATRIRLFKILTGVL